MYLLIWDMFPCACVPVSINDRDDTLGSITLAYAELGMWREKFYGENIFHKSIEYTVCIMTISCHKSK